MKQGKENATLLPATVVEANISYNVVTSFKDLVIT